MNSGIIKYIHKPDLIILLNEEPKMVNKNKVIIIDLDKSQYEVK